jgi:pentatricopeptide repeat protein
MYAKCGHIDDACEVFDRMPYRGIVSWGAMITGYAHQGDSYRALDLYCKMVSDVKPDDVTLLCVLKACRSMGALEQGKLLHMELIENNFDVGVAIGSLLVDMYSKLGHVEDAQNVLRSMPDRSLVVWNAMIGGYAQQGHWRQAWKCTKDMRKEGFRPGHRTYTNLLAAFSHAGKLEEGHRSLKMMADEGEANLTIEHLNCMIDLLGRAGCLGEAVKMLHSIPDLCSSIGWMSLLTACKTYGQTELARACFNEIISLSPNIVTDAAIMSRINVDGE